MKHRATEIKTLITDQIGVSTNFMTAESWVQVKLRLETAGPVAVSTRENIAPPLSGKGGLLNDDNMTFVLNKGDRLFYVAQAVNRVRVIIEPVPEVQVVPVASIEPAVPGVEPAKPKKPRPDQPARLQRRKPPGKHPRWP